VRSFGLLLGAGCTGCWFRTLLQAAASTCAAAQLCCWRWLHRLVLSAFFQQEEALGSTCAATCAFVFWQLDKVRKTLASLRGSDEDAARAKEKERNLITQVRAPLTFLEFPLEYTLVQRNTNTPTQACSVFSVIIFCLAFVKFPGHDGNPGTVGVNDA